MRYLIDPLAPFPTRWTDKDGKPINIMTGPVKGYLMARRPGCVPFILHVAELLNSAPHPHGPFHMLETKKRRAA